MVGGTYAVVFDLDGTLIDSAPDLHVAATRLLAEEGLEAVGVDAVRRMIGEGVGVLVERLFAAHDLTLSPAASARCTERFRALYLEQPCTLTTLLPGAVEVPEVLAAAGVPLGLCTNKPVAHTRRILDTLDLARVFRVVVGGDSLKMRKPHPAPLLHALAGLGVEPTAAAFVGDSAIDHRTARAAGTASVLVDGGYAHEPLAALAADALIPTLEVLPRTLADLWPEGRWPISGSD